MPEFEVHWTTAGVTRIEAETPAEARALLFDYPFSDDAECTDVVEVIPTGE